jgi:hypothetical protein
VANRSFLCASSHREIYPSFVDPSYDSDTRTIATDVYAVPLLWLALFRPEDIVAKTFHVEEDEEGEPAGDVYVEAPVASRADALSALGTAVPVLNALFKVEGPLDSYADYMARAVADAPGEYVTAELQEISCLYPTEEEFFALLRDALRVMAGIPVEDAKRCLVQVADLRLGRPFPPADMLLTDYAAEDDDHWNHCRILGAGAREGGIGRSVPWEMP